MSYSRNDGGVGFLGAGSAGVSCSVCASGRVSWGSGAGSLVAVSWVPPMVTSVELVAFGVEVAFGSCD